MGAIMGQAIRACEEGDFLLVTVSHVTDEDVGIVGRSGKLHVPDCDRAGQSVAVRITGNEEGYIVGTPDRPTPNTDAPLYVQRAVDYDDPDSDQLDEVTYTQWRQRWFAYRLHGALPGALATRVHPQSFTLPDIRAILGKAVGIALFAGLLFLCYAALTAGIDTASRVLSIAAQRPDVTVLLVGLTVLGFGNAYFGYVLYELYIRIAGTLAGASAGFAVGTLVAPAFGTAGAEATGATGTVAFQNAIIFGVVPIVGGMSIGATLGWHLSHPLHKLGILLGGFVALAQPVLVVLAGVSLLSDPAILLEESPLRLAVAVLFGIAGAILAWRLHVVMIVILTSALGAGLLAVALGLALSLISGTVPESIPAITSSLTPLSAPFLLFFSSGIASQLGLSRYLPGTRSGESVDPLDTPSTREGWEPP